MGGEGYCEELSLELSIGGGKYGKESENLREKSSDLCGPNANCKSRCDFSESIDAQRRREIQATRRQEARRKREEKVRKSRGVNNVVGFVDDKLFLEEQRLRERARDREIRENDLFCAGKNGGDEPADELGLSLFSDEKKRENGCLYPNVQLVVPKSDSDYRSISHEAETEKCHKLAPTRSPDSSSQVSSGGEAPEAAPGCSPRLPQMPCVSATGDGPNGRTVIGFLYKYDKREVSIMCVCHGSSFSPAEFVEHAGGVDVSHPLRHITVVT